MYNTNKLFNLLQNCVLILIEEYSGRLYEEYQIHCGGRILSGHRTPLKTLKTEIKIFFFYFKNNKNCY